MSSDRPLAVVALAVALVVSVVLTAATLLGRTGLDLRSLGVASAGALVPATLAVASAHRESSERLGIAATVAATIGLVALTLVDDRRAMAALAVVPVCVLVAVLPTQGPTAPSTARGPRPRLRPLTGVSLVAVVGLGLLWPATGPTRTAVSLNGERVPDADALLARTEMTFFREALNDPAAVVVPGARCYFAEARPAVVCGPIRRHETRPGWHVYPILRDAEGPRPGEPDRGLTFDAAVLWRPDDLRPPDVDGDLPEQGLTPKARPGTVVATVPDEEEAGDEGDWVQVSSGRVSVTRLASPPSLIDEQDVEQLAPDGHRLVAAEVEPDSGVAVTVEVVSSHGRVDVSDLFGEPGRMASTGLIAVVPDNGEAQLAITDRGLTQHVSLETGKRLPGAPPLLYDPRSETLDHEVEETTVTVAAPGPQPHPVDVDLAAHTIEKAELNALDDNRGWADPGRAWLTVTIDGLRTPTWSDRENPDDQPTMRFDAFGSFGLVTGAETLAPTAVQPLDRSGVVVVFDVPDDFTDGVLTSRPNWTLFFGDEQATLEATPETVAIDFG